MSERREYRLHIRSQVSIGQPTTLNNPPQSTGKPERTSVSRFARSDTNKCPPRCVTSQFPIGNLTTQDLIASGHFEDSATMDIDKPRK